MYRFKHKSRKSEKNEIDENSDRSSIHSTTSLSSHGSNSSLSSLVLSIPRFSINSSNDLVTNDNQSLTSTNQKRHSIEHASSCKICHKPNLTNPYNTCSQLRDSQIVTRSESLPTNSTHESSDDQRERSQSFNVEDTQKEYKKLAAMKKNKKQLKRQCIMRLANLYQRPEHSTESLPYGSCSSTLPDLSQVPIQSKHSIETKSRSPLPPVLSQVVHLTPERINYYKQRQIELDRSVKKLLGSFTMKTNENINQIKKYWSYLKKISLDKIQPKTTENFSLFHYLSNLSHTDKQFESYLEEHDEIQAALHILIRILTIVNEKYSFSTINHLFDYVEKLMLKKLTTQLEHLISHYNDQILFIHERIHFYQTPIDGKKNFDWVQCIKVDYPMLIENITDDFILKVPKTNQILLDMLKTMKKHLLYFNIENK
ncbi:unnamed protein product [Adineta steineri]|uniref:Uncharacterized protein n=1 Tax=Adineta steineri TaxID=433720 RepID=A0A815IJ86_9BILA|nr:unnamed protein product [Adineta steineri]CAF3785533.1 unnamed protein product [Adineta steineri]CAF4161309.1 unnamed protein product [Adineta steineri]